MTNKTDYDGEFWGWPDLDPLPDPKDPPAPPVAQPKPAANARLYPPEDPPPDQHDDGYLTGFDNRWD